MDKLRVKNLFDNISYRYDLTNFYISFGIERYWRKKFESEICANKIKALDVCCGTGISTEIICKKVSSNSKVFGIDFADDMLKIAKQKLLKKYKNLTFIRGDAENLDFPSNYFDIITIVFGIRNIINREKVLKELFRVSKQNGKLVIMELSYPQNLIIKKMYNIYASSIVINLGGLITKNKNAYKYLIQTIKDFPQPENFVKIINSCGWSNVNTQKLTLGTCVIYTATALK